MIYSWQLGGPTFIPHLDNEAIDPLIKRLHEPRHARGQPNKPFIMQWTWPGYSLHDMYLISPPSLVRLVCIGARDVV